MGGGADIFVIFFLL